MFGGARAAGIDCVEVHLIIIEDVTGHHWPLHEMDIVERIGDACGIV